MFQLSAEEFANLRSQSVISSAGHGGRRTAPYAFTEQGVATPMATPNCSTVGQSNCSRQDGVIMQGRA